MTAHAASHHPHHASLVNPDGSWKYTNTLIDQTSPYLRQHAHNPVDWLPWGQAAFDLARKRGVPIFLSIGYSTCYWCHVMERQVFENPAIAAQMNRLFVNIKVDREERPDLDDIYMAATQIMTRRGGWPMSVFLTPPDAQTSTPQSDSKGGLKPFWCATYIPPTPMHGMAGFPQVLDALSKAYHNDRVEILEQADKVAHYVSQQLAGDSQPSPPDPRLIRATANAITQTYDTEHGGFGDAPKFPQSCTLSYLLAIEQAQNNQSLWMMIEHTLDRMARGGMYDQIGGGFHRYSVDEQWLVPHFEKMLYDNGQLAEFYTAAYLAHPQSEHADTFRRIAIETCDYVLREMTDPTGAFWSAQDAEVNAMEGGNYVWTPQEVREAINDEPLADLAIAMYGLDQGPNFRDPHIENAPAVNVLHLPQPLANLAHERTISIDDLSDQRKQINARLLAVRSQRDQPATDDKVLTSWNGMMIAGLAAVGGAMERPDLLAASARAADAILHHLTVPDGSLYRTCRNGSAAIPAFLEDYAQLIHGLIVLHRNTNDPRHLDQAIKLTAYATEIFSHPQGGYFDTRDQQPDLIVRTRTSYDGATPSGNSQMAHNLIDLYDITGQQAYIKQAASTLHSFGKAIGQQSYGMTHMLHAMLRLQQRAPRLLDATTPHIMDKALAVELPTQPIIAQNNEARFNLKLIIGSGYHLAADGAVPGIQPATIAVDSAKPVTAIINWPDPVTRHYPFADQPTTVYEGEIAIGLTLNFTDQPPEHINLTLTYQACTEHACEQPTTLALTLSLKQPETLA